MKRRFGFLMILMLVAALTWTACGAKSEVPKETRKAAVAETEKEEREYTPTEPQESEEEMQETAPDETQETETGIEAEPVPAERIAYPFSGDYVPKCVPFPETVLGAQRTYANKKDGMAYWVYAPADQDTLYAYLKLCAYSGLINAEQTLTDGTVRYDLVQPGSDFWAVVYLDDAEEQLLVATDENNSIFEDGTLGALTEYYLQELTLPSENGRYVMPQFYASVGRNPFFQNQMGSLSYCFDDAMHWTEWYNEIDLAKMWRYTSDMLLCGFDVCLDYYEMDDNGYLQLALLHFSNGDAEVIVMYQAAEKQADVHYKPGVSYNLLSGEDYLKYIP